MKRIGRILFLVGITLALGACEDETLITGPAGNGILMGQVTMDGELAGTSAAGIEVSIPRSGMEIILGDDGRFVFSGVPEWTELRFRRASDGVNAGFRVNTSETPDVTIALTRSDARRTSRARPVFARPSLARSTQLEGLILDVAPEGDSITVDAAGKGATLVVIDEQTYIRRGRVELTVADLEPGDRVHVMAQPVGEDLVAKQIIQQVDETVAPKGKTELEGILMTVSETGVEIDAAGKGLTPVAIDEDTVIRKGNRLLDAADLEAGWRVHIRAIEGDEGLVAALIIVQNMNGSDDDEGNGEVQLEGLIVTIDDELIVVDAAGLGETEAVIDENTVIRKGNTTLTVADLEPGDRVHVKARRDGETLIAREIRLQNPA